MSARRLLLPTVPFPRVKRTKAQAAALDRAVRSLPLAPFPVTLARPSDRRVSAEAQRGALTVIADHANGAGFAFLTVATIVREAGWRKRTVQRALAALQAQEHVERYRHLRSPARYPESLPRRARQGEGPSIYRVGRALRAAAGLQEVEWTPGPDWTPASSDGSRGTPEAATSWHPRDRTANDLGRGTAGTDPVAPPNEQDVSASSGSARGTPRTENGKPLTEEERLVPGRSEGTCETDDDRLIEALAVNGQRKPESMADVVERARSAQRRRDLSDLPEPEREFIAALMDAFDGTLVEHRRPRCAYPAHRESGCDWVNYGGRVVCGVCHPPVRRRTEGRE